jgi:predicted nicotinamide N-methyase
VRHRGDDRPVAQSCIAAEIDPSRWRRLRAERRRQRVAVTPRGEDLIGRDEGWDVVFAGDIFYEQELAARVFTWLEGLQRRGARC